MAEYTTNGDEYKWFVPPYDTKYDTYGQPLYNSITTTTEVSLTGLIQELMNRVADLESELVILKEVKPQALDIMKKEMIEEIKNNIGTW